MTEYDLAAQAQAGDIKAALELADRYVETKTLYSLRDALPLLSQAANAGNAYACAKGAAVCVDMACWYEQQEALKEALKTWETGLQFYSLALKTPANTPEQYRETAEGFRERMTYGAASCAWLTAQYQDALAYASAIGTNCTRTSVLLALCKAYAAQAPGELYHVQQIMLKAFYDATYISRNGIGRASAIEQIIFASATRLYADWLAKGLHGLRQNPETASAVTLMAFNAITDDRARSLLNPKKK